MNITYLPVNNKESKVYGHTRAFYNAGTICEFDFKELGKKFRKDLYPFIEFLTLINNND